MTGETSLTTGVVEKPKTAGTGSGMNNMKIEFTATYCEGAAFS
jgi:hypothetical protein